MKLYSNGRAMFKKDGDQITLIASIFQKNSPQLTQIQEDLRIGKVYKGFWIEVYIWLPDLLKSAIWPYKSPEFFELLHNISHDITVPSLTQEVNKSKILPKVIEISIPVHQKRRISW